MNTIKNHKDECDLLKPTIKTNVNRKSNEPHLVCQKYEADKD